MKLPVYVAGCDGATITRGLAVTPSCQMLNIYCVPTCTLCGETKLTVQLDPGVQLNIWGAE